MLFAANPRRQYNANWSQPWDGGIRSESVDHPPAGGLTADSGDSLSSLVTSARNRFGFPQESDTNKYPEQKLWVKRQLNNRAYWSPTTDEASVSKGSKVLNPSQSSSSQEGVSSNPREQGTAVDEASVQATPQNNAGDSNQCQHSSNKPRRKKRPTAAATKTNLKLLYANISEWGPKTEKFLAETKYDVIMLVEHRLSMNQLQDKAVMVAKLGYRMAATCAGKAKTENSGGAMVLCKKHLAAWPTARAPLLYDGGAKPTHAHGHDWMSLQLHLQGTVFHLYVVYMTNSLGPKGVNVTKLTQISNSMDHCRGPCVLIGDWNMEVEEVMTTGLFTQSSVKEFQPLVPHTPLTCTTGKGRVIDFALANYRARTLMTDVVVDTESPWKTHKALTFGLKKKAGTLTCRTLVRPRPTTCAPPEHCGQPDHITWEEAKRRATLPQNGPKPRADVDISHAPLLQYILPAEKAKENCDRLKQIGAAIDQYLIADKGILPEFQEIYKGRFNVPEYKTCKVIKKGPAISPNPWSIHIVRWNAIAARLLEMAKELEKAARPVHHKQFRLPRILREYIWQLVDDTSDMEEKMKLLSFAIRSCSVPMLEPKVLIDLAAETDKWKNKAEYQHSKHTRFKVHRWATSAVAGTSSDAFAYIKQSKAPEQGVQAPDGQGVFYNPDLVMAARTTMWQKQWTAKDIPHLEYVPVSSSRQRRSQPSAPDVAIQQQLQQQIFNSGVAPLDLDNLDDEDRKLLSETQARARGQGWESNAADAFYVQDAANATGRSHDELATNVELHDEPLGQTSREEDHVPSNDDGTQLPEHLMQDIPPAVPQQGLPKAMMSGKPLGAGSYMVPPLSMVESAYRKPKPKKEMFTTGLLARMRARGGVKTPPSMLRNSTALSTIPDEADADPEADCTENKQAEFNDDTSEMAEDAQDSHDEPLEDSVPVHDEQIIVEHSSPAECVQKLPPAPLAATGPAPTGVAAEGSPGGKSESAHNEKWARVGAVLVRRAQRDQKHDPRVPLTGDELFRSMGRTRSACGIEFTVGQELRSLPAEAWHDMAIECNRWEDTLALPIQTIISLMAVLPKPQGGERLIALMHRLLRAFFKARRWFISSWEQSRADWWDNALKGSSALRAAVLRSFGSEAAVLAGASVVAAFVDIAKFYDSLDPVILVTQLIKLHFPTVSLLLHLQAHWGLRCVTKDSAVGRLFAGTRSILAGCTSSNSMARGYLHHICEAVSWKIPSARLSTFVDDFVLWLVGSRVTLPHEMSKAVYTAYHYIQAAGLDISEKSLLVASSKQIAIDAVKELKQKHNIKLDYSVHAKDLGVGTTLGCKRTSLVLTARRKRAQKKTSKARTIQHVLKGAASSFFKKLWTTAIEPTMLYGAVATGVGKTAMAAVRAEAINATDLSMKGQSTTAVLAVVLGNYSDPAIKLPTAIVLQWLQIARSQVQEIPGMPSLWRLSVKHLRSKGEHKLHYVKGPMCATIATLLDASWEPEEWNYWYDTYGTAWHLAEEDQLVVSMKTCDPMLRAFRRDLQEKLWANSTSSYFLDEKIPHTAPLRKLWLSLQKQGKYDEAKLLIRIFGGGLWTAKRVADAVRKSTPVDESSSKQQQAASSGEPMHNDSDKGSPHCRLCGAPEQTEWHTAYECGPVLAAERFKDSQRMLESAEKQKGHNAALWLRGCCVGLYDEVPLPSDEDNVTYWPQEMWQPGCFFSDASGGKDTADPHLRRVGVGACSLSRVLDIDGNFAPDVDAFLRAPLPGLAQTVNRGELYAIIKVLEHVIFVPDRITTIITDSQYCMDGYRAGEAAQQAAFNDDLWHLFFRQVRRLDGLVHLVKVKSHMEVRDAVLGHILLRDMVGNAMADSIARIAADAAQLDPKLTEGISNKVAHSIKVMKHLISANLENLRQLEAKGLRNQQGQDTPKPSAVAGATRSRGHQLVNIGLSLWRCRHCLSIRKSRVAFRWPKQCSGIFKHTDSALHPPIAFRSAPADGFGANPAVEPTNAARIPSLDEAEADPLQHLESDVESHGEPPVEHEDFELHAELDQPAPERADPAPGLVLPGSGSSTTSASWWSKVGEQVAISELKIGGATIHHSHWVGWFGNSTLRVVFCARCGGTTSGSHSPLLAVPCRQQANPTRARQLVRMMRRGLWPSPSMQAHGRGVVSPVISFQPTSSTHALVRLRQGELCAQVPPASGSTEVVHNRGRVQNTQVHNRGRKNSE